MESLWTKTQQGRAFPTLEGDLVVDVAVVGGGIAGLTAAYLLERAGVGVAVLEARTIAGGESGRTTAHLTVLRDTPYATLARDFGTRGARLSAAGARAAIELIHTVSKELAIDCDFHRLPAFLFTGDEDELESLEQEARHLRDAGEDAEIVAVPSPFFGAGALRVQNQAAFHPRKYLLPLAERIHGGRGHVFEHTRVLEVKDGAPCELKTEHGTVRAKKVLVCTDSPISTRLFLHPKLACARTYVVGARVEKPLGFLLYDTQDPYHYVRTHPLPDGGHLLIVGGEDHRVGTEPEPEERLEALREWTTRHFGALEFTDVWTGEVLEPVDGLPYIGRSPFGRHVSVATGFSGTGMTDGTLSGMVLSDEVLGRRNVWARLLNATRLKPLASAKEFVSHNVGFPLHLIEDRLRPAEAHSLDEIPPGEGRLTSVDGRTLAVYRSESGEVSALSPVCTHLGCHVHWNGTEKSWDCPCHGSRFDVAGEVLHGPATRALERVTLDEETHERAAEGPSGPPTEHPS